MSEEETFPEEQTAESYSIDTEPKSIYAGIQQHEKDEQDYSSRAESSEEEDRQHQQSQDDSDSDVIEILSGPEDASPVRLNKDAAGYHSEFESEVDASESESSSKDSNSSEEESDDEEKYNYSEEEEEADEQVHPLINFEARETVHTESDDEVAELEDSDIEEIISDDGNGETEQEESEDEAKDSVASEAGSIGSVVDIQEEPAHTSVNLFASEEYSSHLIDPSFSDAPSFGAIPHPIATDSLHHSDIIDEDLVSETQLANALQTLANSAQVHHQFHHEQVNHGEDHFVPRSEVDELTSKDIVEAVNSISDHSFPADASVRASIDLNTTEIRKPDSIVGVGVNGHPIKNLTFHDVTIPIKPDTTVNFSFGESFTNKQATPEPLPERTETEQEIINSNDKDILAQYTVQTSEPDQKEPTDISLADSHLELEDHVENTVLSSANSDAVDSFSAPIAFGVPTLNSSVGYSFGERFYTPIETKPAINTKETKIIEANSKFGSFAASVWADLSTAEKPVSHSYSTSVETSVSQNKSESESFPTEEIENSEVPEHIEEVDVKVESQKELQYENAEPSVSPEEIPVLDDKKEEQGEHDKSQDKPEDKPEDKPLINEIVTEDVEMLDVDEIHSLDDGLSLLAQNAFEALGGIESIESEKAIDSDVEVTDKAGLEDTKPIASSVEASVQVQPSVEPDLENEGEESSCFVDAIEVDEYYDAPTTLENLDESSEDTDAEGYADVLEPAASKKEDIELKDQEPVSGSSMPIDPALLESSDKPSAPAEEQESSDESVIFLDEVNAPQESEEEGYESDSDQSEGNYTLNETARPEGNINENDAEQDERSDSEEAGNHSMFLIDQLNEVESTQVEDSESSESFGTGNDVPNIDLQRVLDADDKPETEEVILSNIEEKILTEEIHELVREDPEFNSQELIDQGTPISTEIVHISQSAEFGIDITRQETIEVRKEIFTMVENDSGLEDTKERIPTHLMDNPTSDDYLYEAQMKEAAASSTAHEHKIQSPNSPQQAVDSISNPPVTVVPIDNSTQSETVIPINTEESSVKDGSRSDGEEEKVEIEASITEKPDEELQSTTEVSETIDIAVVTQDLDTSSSPSSEQNVEFKDDDSSSGDDFASEAQDEDPKVSEPQAVKDEAARAAVQSDPESTERGDNNRQESEQSDKESQDSDPEPKVIEEGTQKAVEAESKPLETDEPYSLEEQQDAMDIDEDEGIHQEASTHESEDQNEIALQENANAENLKSESQDIEMGEIGQDDEEPNNTDQFKQKEKINTFLDTLIKSSNEDENEDDKVEEDDLNAKDKGDDNNNLANETKSHATSDENDDDENDDKLSKEEPMVTKSAARRTRQMRVTTKKSAFLAEVIKQQKRKTRNAATAKEEKTEAASPSPLAASPATKRSQKERKTKLETAKQKRASQRSQSESSTGGSSKTMSNSPPHMSLRSGRRIATGSDSAAASGTKPATASIAKGGRGKRSGMEAGNAAVTKGPVNKKSSSSGGAGKRKGRGKAGKR